MESDKQVVQAILAVKNIDTGKVRGIINLNLAAIGFTKLVLFGTRADGESKIAHYALFLFL